MQFEQLQKKTSDLLGSIIGFWEPVAPGTLLDEDRYLRLMSVLSEKTKCPEDTLATSYYGFIGGRQTRSALSALCWHLAANKRELQQGTVIHYNQPMLRSGVIEARIGSVKLAGQLAAIQLHILTGPLASRIRITKMLRTRADRLPFQLGHTFHGAYPAFETDVSLPGLFAKIQLKTEKPTDDWDACELTWLEAKDVIAWNRRNILKYRTCVKPCKFGKREAETRYCYCVTGCEKGWESCSASGHAMDYYLQGDDDG